MISLNEMLCGVKWEDIPAEHQANLEITLNKVNMVRAAYNKAMTPTNSYRTMKHHLEIYAAKGITDQSKIPMKSNHLFGNACDIADTGLLLTKWLKETPEGKKVMEDANLFCEDGNSNWVHFQTVPFGSYKPGGTRWFKP
jgi:hypothetical protein